MAAITTLFSPSSTFSGTFITVWEMDEGRRLRVMPLSKPQDWQPGVGAGCRAIGRDSDFERGALTAKTDMRVCRHYLGPWGLQQLGFPPFPKKSRWSHG
jgi:hypothetical protein